MAFAAGLFGAHVSGVPRNGPVLPKSSSFSQPEVGQVRGARLVDQDVARLDVAMDQPLRWA